MKTLLDFIPPQFWREIGEADALFLQARAADAAGDLERATELRDRATAIYERVIDAAPANLRKETE